MDKHAMMIIVGSLSLLVLVQVTAKKCEFTTTFHDDAKLVSAQGELNCPGPDDPSNHTECCLNPKFVCCPESPVVYKIDNHLVRIVGMTVITTCICLSVITLICCFWNSCPLYNTCREDYTLTDVVAYAKDDDSINSDMPAGEKSRTRNYNVKIKPVEEV